MSSALMRSGKAAGKGLLRPLVRLAVLVLASLSRLISREKVVLFSSYHGAAIGGNTYHLFKRLCEVAAGDGRVVLVWFYKGAAVPPERGKNVRLVKWNSLRALWYVAKATVACTSWSGADIPLLGYARHVKVLFLNHGTPIRAEWKEISKGSTGKTSAVVNDAHLATVIIDTSREAALQTARFQEVGVEKFRITGLPTNDYLLDGSDVDHWREVLGVAKEDVVCLYSPTWRLWGPTRFFPFPDLDLESLNDFLASRRIKILLRPHHNDCGDAVKAVAGGTTLRLKAQLDSSGITEFRRLRELPDRCSNLVWAGPDQLLDAQPILKCSDILMTDYSSIYYDFLILDRPCFFLPYDFQRFSEWPGFVCDYMATTAGPKIDTQRELMAELDKIVGGRDDFTDQRARMRDYYHQFKDDQSSERVARVIFEELL